jgi:two-component system, CAI-1 autoinducer sensor kinase/phosphatase CqsS
VEFYPPGVIFTSIGLGVVAIAVAKYELMNPVTIASSVAHEMRTPLSTIRFQAEFLSHNLPEILAGYQLAVEHKLCTRNFSPATEKQLKELAKKITHQIDISNVVIDMLLAAVKMNQVDPNSFKQNSLKNA